MARYTLTISDKMMDELRHEAKKHDCDIKDIVRQCLTFGLIAREACENEDKRLIKDENGEETELYFIS